jgi:DNA-binding NarL/FixJ family response regulator
MIVDDHEMVRDALTELIDSFADHEVVASTNSLRNAGPLLERTQPDLVLADLSLEDGRGTEMVRMIRQAKQKALVLIMTSFRDAFAASEALKAGVAGYVLKAQPTRDLKTAIAAVMAGQRYVSPDVPLPPAEASSPTTASPPAMGELSRRENEIFRLVVEGLSSKEIARRLCISVKTVETHRSNIYRKVSVRRTSDLIRFAVAQGISVAPSHPGTSPDRAA